MNCRYFEKCGACSLLSVGYKDQLLRKKESVADAFKAYRLPIEVADVEGMSEPFGYRNKVIVYVTSKAGKTVFGMYEENSHKIVPTAACLLHDKRLNAVLDDLQMLLSKLKIRPDGFGGVLKNVLLRVGAATGQVMVVFVTSDDMFHGRNDLVKKLVALHPEIRTIVQNTNPRKTSVILGEREKVLYGSGYIYDVLLGKRYKISPRSFYQINPSQTSKLYSKAIELAGLSKMSGPVVLDAYCGIGTIGLSASADAGKLIGVEINPDAVRDAKMNARTNDVTNASFFCEDAKTFMRGYDSRVDVLFIDPPRSGCDEEFLSSVLKLRPGKIVYISCNPETQARDIKTLRKAYNYSVAYPFDMFPQTRHVENIVLLELL